MFLLLYVAVDEKIILFLSKRRWDNFSNFPPQHPQRAPLSRSQLLQSRNAFRQTRIAAKRSAIPAFDVLHRFPANVQVTTLPLCAFLP
jgi:hypothetical protein